MCKRMVRAAAIAALLPASMAWAGEPPAAPPAATADIGGRRIVLPPPPGWILVDTSSDDAMAPFARFVSHNERVLAGFAPKADDRSPPSGASLMKIALAASTFVLESEDIGPRRFAEILEVFRDEMPEAEVVVQDADALGLLVLVQAQTDAGDPMPDYWSATLMLFARVNSRFVRLSLFDFTASAARAEAFKSTAFGWLVALRAANAGAAQPEM